jgi:hypothetical protein
VRRIAGAAFCAAPRQRFRSVQKRNRDVNDPGWVRASRPPHSFRVVHDSVPRVQAQVEEEGRLGGSKLRVARRVIRMRGARILSVQNTRMIAYVSRVQKVRIRAAHPPLGTAADVGTYSDRDVPGAGRRSDPAPQPWTRTCSATGTAGAHAITCASTQAAPGLEDSLTRRPCTRRSSAGWCRPEMHPDCACSRSTGLVLRPGSGSG